MARRSSRHHLDSRIVAAAVVLLALPGLLAVIAHRGSETRLEEPDGPGLDDYDWAAPDAHRPDPQTLAVGVTHTQYSIGNWANASANASASAVLTATATYQNQHIFGWGALNPEPRPGVFDWSSLDRRMALIRSTGGTPVITLCCAPDWMKGGRPGDTDWSLITKAPTRDHYADFAALAVAVARRYPDVRRYQVWNELKGFWDTSRNRWSYEAYTDFYNVVYDALKAFNPSIAVGGPYVVVDLWASRAAGGHPSRLAGACGTVDQRSLDVLEYWLRHKHGADFVSVDASSRTRDAGTITSTTLNAALFDAVTRWLRARTSLPIWWSEFHVGSADANGQRQLVARAVAALLHMIDSGASAALVWQPERDVQSNGAFAPALWTSTSSATGGRPLPYADAIARLQQLIADRSSADPVSWPIPEVGLMRGRHALLVVNTGAGQVSIEAAGRRLRLAPYEVRYEVRYVSLPAGAPTGPAVPVASPAVTAAQRCLWPVPLPQQISSPEWTDE